jgi:hypothetical protein
LNGCLFHWGPIFSLCIGDFIILHQSIEVFNHFLLFSSCNLLEAYVLFYLAIIFVYSYSPPISWHIKIFCNLPLTPSWYITTDLLRQLNQLSFVRFSFLDVRQHSA